MSFDAWTAQLPFERARRDMLAVSEREFWELNERGVDFDWVAPERRGFVIEVLDGLRADAV